MGIVKNPTNNHDEDVESPSSMEDELLSDQDQENLGPMPLDEYLRLRFRLFARSYSWNLVQVTLVTAGLMACAMIGAAAVHQSVKISFNSLRPEPAPVAHHASPFAMPTTTWNLPPACNYEGVVLCPARSLFQNPEIHRVVAHNLMRTSNRLLKQSDYDTVLEFAQAGFQRISAELEVRAPVVAKELGQVQFNVAQKNAVLDLMALLSDVSVQSLGFDVAMIIRKSKFHTKKILTSYIEDSLNPIDEIQKLAHEIVPKSVLELWGKGGHNWEMTLDPQNIHSMRNDHIKPPANITFVDVETKSLSIYVGILRMGKVMLDIMKIHIRANTPSGSTTLHDTVEHLSRGIAPPTDSNKLAYMEAFLWPLKCGVQGLDALRFSVNQE